MGRIDTRVAAFPPEVAARSSGDGAHRGRAPLTPVARLPAVYGNDDGRLPAARAGPFRLLVTAPARLFPGRNRAGGGLLRPGSFFAGLPASGRGQSQGVSTAVSRPVGRSKFANFVQDWFSRAC